MNPNPNKGDYKNTLKDHPGLEWVVKLDTFFQDRADDIVFVTKHMSGQRELWLQGEILLDLGRVEDEDTSHFSMNEELLFTKSNSEKADLYIPDILIAEIKLVSSKHAMKAMYGLNNDLLRLRRANVESVVRIPRLLILVLVDEGEPYETGEFGARIRTFEPPKTITTEELTGFGPQDGGPLSVRVWSVNPEGEDKESPR